MNASTPFHEGELFIQKLAKESDIAQRNGAVISNKIPPGAISFVGDQLMVVVSSLDKNGRVWASLLVGNPGFIKATAARLLSLDTTAIISHTSDIFWENIKANPQIGVLAIELSTRRRLRVNGTIHSVSDTCFHIAVEQAYPNCPKYIQRRHLKINKSPYKSQQAKPEFPAPLQGSTLTANHIEIITKSDTLFVGSASPILSEEQISEKESFRENFIHGGDASHRGGNPGFVEVVDNQCLRIPDYKGNSMFNTLGNIQQYPHASLLFVDFKHGRLLQLSGTAKILWNEKDPTNKTDGTKRFWELSIEQWRESQLPAELNWEFFDYSPHNPEQITGKPGSTDELELKVLHIEQKSERIKQFRLVAANGGILPAFEPGAHLPVEVTLPMGKKATRHYSLLSSNDDNRFYEIAVQHEPEGRGGSKYIHQHLNAGATIYAKQPRNDFPLSPIGKHTILIAGGIGITPILAMLRSLAEQKFSFEIHYTARTQADLAFQTEVIALAGDNAHLYFSQGANAKRLDLKTLMKKPAPDTHVFMCGPMRMINTLRDLGKTFGWNPEQIHFESFGASTFTNNSEITVTLKKSAQVVVVQPKQTILDALTAANVSIPYDCKRGECGMCSTEVIAGETDHRDVCLSKEQRKHNMCVCVSRAKGKELTLNL